MTCKALWIAIRRLRLELSVALLLLVAAAQVIAPVEFDNVLSRHLMLGAIVNHGTLTIDRYAGWTADASTHDGHLYSNKAIGAVAVAVPVYWAIRAGTGLGRLAEFNVWELYLVRLVTTSLLFALGGGALCWLIRQWTGSSRRAWAAAVVYGLGTFALLHGSSFSGHGITCSMTIVGMALVELVRQAARGQRSWLPWQADGLAFGAGFSIGLGAASEYLAIFVALVLTGYVLSLRLGWRRVGWFLAGGACWAGLLGAYHWACFGAVWRTPYAALSDPFFEAQTATGLMGIGLPTWHGLIGLSLLPGRSLAILSPFLVLAIPGWVGMWRHGWRREAVTGIAACLGMGLVIAGYFGWHGGYGIGPRYLLAIVPFLVLAAAWVRFPPRWLWLPVAMGAMGGAQTLLAAIGIHMVPHYVWNPLLEVTWPIVRDYGAMAVTPWHLLIGTHALWPWWLVALSTLACGGIVWRELRRAAAAESSAPSGLFLPRWGYLALTVWLVIAVGLVALLRTPDPYRVPYAKVVVLRALGKAADSTSYAAGLGRALDRPRLGVGEAVERLNAEQIGRDRSLPLAAP